MSNIHNQININEKENLLNYDKTIYFDDFYNKLFSKHTLFNVVMISSKIIVSNNKLIYTNNRSVYSNETRFNQTFETIESIKKHIPNYYIILFDNSDFTDDMYLKIKKSVNIFINITDNENINYCTNVDKNKGVGELLQIKYMLKFVDEIKFKNLFKITGRYLINEKFDFEKFNSNDNNMFKKNDLIEIDNYYYTCFYKISNTNYNEYKNTVIKTFEDNYINKYYEPLEVLFPRLLNYNFKVADFMGITERIAVVNYSTEI